MKKYVLTLLAGTVFCSMTALATPTEEVKNVGAQETIKIEAPLHKKARASKGRENFVKRLQLSEEQQKKADEIHQKSKGEMKEIHSQILVGGSHLSHPQAHSYLQGYLRMFTFGDLKAINHF